MTGICLVYLCKYSTGTGGDAGHVTEIQEFTRRNPNYLWISELADWREFMHDRVISACYSTGNCRSQKLIEGKLLPSGHDGM